MHIYEVHITFPGGNFIYPYLSTFMVHVMYIRITILIYAYYCIILYLPIYLSTCLSTCLSIYLSIHVYVYVSHISGMGLIGSPPKNQVADETGFTMSEARQKVEMLRNSKLLPAKNMALTGKQVCFTGRSVV